MFRTITSLILLTFFVTACAESPDPSASDNMAEQPAASEAVEMTDAQKRAYALGANSAGFLARSFPEFDEWGIAIDKELVKQGFIDMLEDKPKIPPEELQTILMAFQQELQQKVAQIEAEQQAKAQAANTTFLTSHAEQEGVAITESGLQYRILQEGTGPMPKAGDVVRVHYKGTLIDGTQFDSSYDRGQPIDFEVERVIPGWAEGIQLVKEGGKIELVMGPDLGYGAQATPTIPAYSALVFEVELIKVNPEPEPPQVEETQPPQNQ